MEPARPRAEGSDDAYLKLRREGAPAPFAGPATGQVATELNFSGKLRSKSERFGTCIYEIRARIVPDLSAMKRKTYLDRYRVIADERGALAVLRRHGTAVTYKAEDTRDGSEVEVEVILAFGLKPRVREELAREGKAARQLNHPNIPALREFESETDQFVYVWEHVAGTSVEAWVKAHGPMPVGPALRIASQIVSALGAAAFQSLVHRAINPENVVLVPGQTPQGDWPMVKILQWIGTVPAGSKYAGKNMASDATASFVSPEQKSEGVVNFQSEIYSLGATLWFLLTGAPPIAETPLPRLSGVPKPALHLLEQMLARDPEQRPHDPVAFEESLRDCLSQVDRREAVGRKFGVPVAVAEPAAIKTATPHRPIPWKPLALAALFLGLAAVGAFLLPRSLHPSEWFSGSKESRSIGVPIGVPDSVARAASSYPEPGNTDSDSDDEVQTPAPALVATNSAAQPAPEISPTEAEAPRQQLTASNTTVTPAEASAPSTPPAPLSASASNSQPTILGDATTEAAATLVKAEASSEASFAKVEKEPETPAEGPAEASKPPAYVAQETDATERIREEEDVADSRPVRAAAVEHEPAAAKPSDERVARLNGLPVRRAEPVRDEDLQDQRAPRSARRIRRMDGREVRLAEPIYEGEEVPGQPRPANRARVIGTTPEGEMVFEAPSAERGYVRPRR